MNTAYRTDASDSFAFKFLDGICTTVIEVDNLCLCVQPSNISQRPGYQDLLQVDGALQVISVVAFYGAWGTGKWYFGARTEDE